MSADGGNGSGSGAAAAAPADAGSSFASFGAASAFAFGLPATAGALGSASGPPASGPPPSAFVSSHSPASGGFGATSTAAPTFGGSIPAFCERPQPDPARECRFVACIVAPGMAPPPRQPSN